jgi:hypothetical protein
LSSDVKTLPQQDLRVRITPFDAATRIGGVAGESAVFSIGQGTAPRILTLSTPSGAGGGWITFQYTVADAEGDSVGLQGEFSTDGSTFRTAELGRGDGADSVTATPGGTPHSIAWNAQANLPGTVRSGILFRLRGVDVAAGPFMTSGTFSLDTRGPVIDILTIEAIPVEMNGSIPFTNLSSQSQEFTLLAADQAIQIWIGFLPGSSSLDPASLTVSASVPLGGGSAAGGADAGASFGQGFAVDLDTGLATMTVGPNLAIPHGPVTITARIGDVRGNLSEPVSYSFETGPATPERRPFDVPERWFLDFSRDNFTISSTVNSQLSVTITATQGADGVADFVEDLRILGLQSASPPPAAVGARLNELVLAAVEQGVLGHLNEFYGRNFDGSANGNSAAIQFSVTPPAGPFSRIGIGGDDPVPGFTIGRAEFDYRNTGPNDDSPIDLGIFTTNLIDFYINTSFTFTSRFNPLIPGRGTPLGFSAEDVTVLSSSFNRSNPANTAAQNRRYDDLAVAIDAMGRVTAVILAHEIGHSVGLVANGAPPGGLFGGEYRASFSGPYTNTFHLDTSANDIMASSLGFSGAMATGSSAPRFNELTMAYLLERILLE